MKNRKIDIDEAIVSKIVKKMGYKTMTDFFSCIADERLDVNEVIDNYMAMLHEQQEAASGTGRISAETFDLRIKEEEDAGACLLYTSTVLNLNKISKANGAPILASSGQMSPEGTESTGMFIPASLMKPLDAMITAAPGASDTSRAVMFTTRKGYTGLILKINDPETVEQTLSRQLQPAEEIEDCETYTTGRGIIALRGNICVIAPDAATIKEITESRSPQWRISKMEGVRQFLSTEDVYKRQ